MEREMKSSDGTTNVHLLEERGIVVDMDEEELYSKVHSSEIGRASCRERV